MSRSRSTSLLAAGLLVVVALLVVGVLLRDQSVLPVVAHFGAGAGSTPIGLVAVGPAVLVPPALVALVAALRGAGRLRQTAVLWALGASSPILLVLVARLNGVAEASSLVLVYASCAGGVLLRTVHRPGGDPLPLRWSAVLGIVPWGVVAFSQIGGLLTGTPPADAIRALTVVVLAASIGEYVVAYRRRNAPIRPALALLLAALPGVLLAVLVVV